MSSVGSVSDSYDNALAKTINGLYKAETEANYYVAKENLDMVA